jgi:hypothetical protein
MRKYKPSDLENDIIKFWYELKMNIKGQDPQTGFYLSSKKTHTGLKCINAENESVTSERYQIEIALPMYLWQLAEAAPGSRITPATRAERQYIRSQGWTRTTKRQMSASDRRIYNMIPPKGIRFGGYRTAEEAATVFKAWMDNPVLFVQSMIKGTGAAKYYQ